MRQALLRFDEGVALAANPAHKAALGVRLEALEKLNADSKNSNERSWLEYAIHQVKNAQSESGQ